MNQCCLEIKGYCSWRTIINLQLEENHRKGSCKSQFNSKIRNRFNAAWLDFCYFLICNFFYSFHIFVRLKFQSCLILMKPNLSVYLFGHLCFSVSFKKLLTNIWSWRFMSVFSSKMTILALMFRSTIYFAAIFWYVKSVKVVSFAYK